MSRENVDRKRGRAGNVPYCDDIMDPRYAVVTGSSGRHSCPPISKNLLQDQSELALAMSSKTVEMLTMIKSATLGYADSQLRVDQREEDGLTSVEDASVPRYSSFELEEDYLVGDSFSLDGCEDEYFARYFEPAEPQRQQGRGSARAEPEEQYEPEVEIFELEL